MQVSAEGGQWVLHAGPVTARIHPALRSATVWATPAELAGESLTHASRAAWALTLESLLVVLREAGEYALHAAGLVRRGDGLLVVAQQDCGKSTLAYTLVRDGWSYLSDDTVLVRVTPGGVGARGFRSYFTLDPDADGLFPELAGGRIEPLFGEAKCPVDVDALHPGRRAEACRPRAIVFPQIVDADESRVEPVGPVDALRHVVGQSALALAEPTRAPAHIAALTALVRQCDAYRLYSGRDLLDRPGRATELLAPLLSSA